MHRLYVDALIEVREFTSQRETSQRLYRWLV